MKNRLKAESEVTKVQSNSCRKWFQLFNEDFCRRRDNSSNNTSSKVKLSAALMWPVL